ncbi:hypothetical protein [Clostridium butyricum]|uniref:hypothetical protein n=1 Tax=Clostridium butyricum TaxID=1492 RepID=UPI0003A8A793|nr:hypothetical protein [Clostridium butyricum]MBZ5745717.1 hypothetical protein [Clostridium butyricum]MDI9210756.1 hypothetical protein [Clostridium butyricum]BBK78208.1 hypothetical protein Cbu04g_32160 [Clostridium butyricum]GEQ26683.1 hypothetical protein CBU03nite_31060 [Clostridium butyricum]
MRVDLATLVMPLVYGGYIFKNYIFKYFKLNYLLMIISVTILYYYYTNGLDISYAQGKIGNPISFFVVVFWGFMLICA